MTGTQFPNGLIVSPGIPTAAPLDELVAHFGWPLLLDATATKLCRAMDQQRYFGVWFWVERHQHATATANLVTWLCRRYPNVHRFVLAYQQEQDVELILRSAGLHAYLPASSDIAAIVEEAMWPLLRCDGTLAAGRTTAAPTEPSRAAANQGKGTKLVRPP
jgi:hypothetical protein